MASFVRNLLNYFHTIRYLRPIQIIGRLKRYFKYNRVNNNPAGAIRTIQEFGKFLQSALNEYLKKMFFVF